MKELQEATNVLMGKIMAIRITVTELRDQADSCPPMPPIHMQLLSGQVWQLCDFTPPSDAQEGPGEESAQDTMTMLMHLKAETPRAVSLMLRAHHVRGNTNGAGSPCKFMVDPFSFTRVTITTVNAIR